MAVITALGIGGGFLPSIWAKSSQHLTKLSYANCFSGALFLALSFEFYAESEEMFEETRLGDSAFPFAMAFAVFAILLILICDIFAHNHEISLDSEPSSNDTKTPPLALALLLSIHALIEGAYLGSVVGTNFITVFIAISSHQFSESFALGAALVKSNLKSREYLTYIVVLALATPVGQLIGLLFSTVFTSEVSTLFAAIFSSLGSGTFIYVALAEILHPELAKKATKREKFIKIGFCAFGFISVLFIIMALEFVE
ncbi:hypothetical protein RCL1_000616 [Eukaryota sp. TZLM3-RCL]